MRTETVTGVKENHDDDARAVHVAQPAAGVSAGRQLLPRPHRHGRPPADLPAQHDARLRLAPAAVIAVVVRDIVVGHRPVYALGEWAARYDDPTVLGLGPGDADLLNYDRVGRT